MPERRRRRSRILRGIYNRLFDILILALLCSFTLCIRHYFRPFRRGFFCQDRSIQYPYIRDETVPTRLLIILALLVPIPLLFLFELIHSFDKKKERQHFGRKCSLRCLDLSAPPLINGYKYIGHFLFGQATNLALTTLIKYCAGSLRPYFMAVCQPNIAGSHNCSLSQQHQYYVLDYHCTTNVSEMTSARLIEARQSFLSGHASISFFTAVYLSIYLNERMHLLENTVSRLLIPFVQILLISLSLFCALSRLTDYRHHSFDVLAGIFLGSLLAIVVSYWAGIFRMNQGEKVEEGAEDEERNESIVYGHQRPLYSY